MGTVNLFGELALDASVTALTGTRDAVASASQKGIAALAIRQDSDTTVVADGDLSAIHTDSEGRIKVSVKPGLFASVTGNIVANGGAVVCDVTRASNVMLQCYGTFSTVNVTFEGSINSTNGTDGNWVTLQAVRSNANTIETTTGNLSAAPAYAWELSVNAFTWFRVRATAWTSGTQTWVIQRGAYATEPIPAAQISGTQPISGSVTASGTVTANQGTLAAPTASNINSAANTNTAFIKNAAGTVYNVSAYNAGAATAYVKLYNQATAPTLASAVPVIVIPVPATSTVSMNLGVLGHRFATGIAIAITGGAADTDTTNTAANQVKVMMSYI